MDREAFVQAWLNTEEQVPVDLVQFDFLPDPESENWFEAAAHELHAVRVAEEGRTVAAIARAGRARQRLRQVGS